LEENYVSPVATLRSCQSPIFVIGNCKEYIALGLFQKPIKRKKVKGGKLNKNHLKKISRRIKILQTRKEPLKGPQKRDLETMERSKKGKKIPPSEN